MRCQSNTNSTTHPRSPFIDGLLISAGILMWVGCGIIEHNWLIPAFAIIGCLGGIAISFWITLRRAIFRVYLVGFVLRSVVCLLAWYQAKGTRFQFWTGLNEDSNRYFLNSYLGIKESAASTEDPGFPILNSVITGLASKIGQDHYLVNVQVPLLAGTLFAVAVYALGKRIANEQCALIAAWLIACNPIVVGWSTGLMRDTLVATLGWLMVYAVVQSLQASGFSRILNIAVAATTGVFEWSLRSVSCVYLIGVALVLNVFNCRTSKRMGRFNILVAGFVLLVACTMAFNPSVRARIESIFAYGKSARESVGTSSAAINSGGLSEKIADSKSIGIYVISAMYMFLAPFPVYASPTDFDGDPGRPIDYLMNLGGLANLAMLSYFFAGLLSWLHSRQYGNFIVAGPLFYLTCLAFMLGTGQSRWLMAFSYPLYFVTVAEAIRVTSVSRRRHSLMPALAALVVVFVYSCYWLLKINVGFVTTTGSIGSLLIATLATFLAIYWRMLKNDPLLMHDERRSKSY